MRIDCVSQAPEKNPDIFQVTAPKAKQETGADSRASIPDAWEVMGLHANANKIYEYQVHQK